VTDFPAVIRSFSAERGADGDTVEDAGEARGEREDKVAELNSEDP